MTSYDEFLDGQKIVYELKPLKQTTRAPSYDTSDREEYDSESEYYDNEILYYQEGIPTKETNIPMLRLMNGHEPIENMERRYELFNNNWNKQLNIIEKILNKNDKDKFLKLKNFLDSKQKPGFLIGFGGGFPGRGIETSYEKLTCALLNLGSNISNHSRLLDQVSHYLQEEGNGGRGGDVVVVRLHSKVCVTIKITLRMIMLDVMRQLRGRSDNDGEYNTYDDYDEEDYDRHQDEEDEGKDQEEEMDDENGSFKIKKHDFDDVINKLKQLNKSLIVIIEDADSFTTIVLTTLLKNLWNYNKLNENKDVNLIKVIVGISTPFLIFKEKLPKLTIQFLRLTNFQIDNSNESIDEIMENLLLNINDTYNSLIFEPLLILEFLKLKTKISIKQFINYMKLIYMNHYFNQPLSILWTDDFSSIKLSVEYFEIFKKLPSIRKFDTNLTSNIGFKLTNEKSNEINDFYSGIILNDKETIGRHLRANLNRLINWRINFKNLIDLLNFIQEYFLKTNIWFNNLELFKLIFENLNFQSSNSTNIFHFLKPIWDTINSEKDLNSINSFLKTILEDEEFSFILQHLQIEQVGRKADVPVLVAELQNVLNAHIHELNLDNIPFKEICTVSSISLNELLTNSFNPQLRYLTMTSILNSKVVLFNSIHSNLNLLSKTDINLRIYKMFEPSLIELFKLYREAGVIVNLYDFYQVFKYSIDKRQLVSLLKLKVKDAELLEVLDGVNVSNDEDEGDGIDLNWDKLTLSWFLKSLMELQILGLFKEGKGKSSESIEKIIWKGL